jgi:hypothetical protein
VQRRWRQVPAILVWETLRPLGLAGMSHGRPSPPASGSAGALVLLRDCARRGGFVLISTLLPTLVPTLVLGCFIVWVLKGPACVADACPLPE